MSKPVKAPLREPEKPQSRLRPHPRLFKVMCVAFALWMLVLLAMYFWTVYPLRHPKGP
jgi:hypothetical protein